jgi:hypothetical protein
MGLALRICWKIVVVMEDAGSEDRSCAQGAAGTDEWEIYSRCYVMSRGKFKIHRETGCCKGKHHQLVRKIAGLLGEV